MRSIINKKKTFVILAISLFLLFNVLAISNVYGATKQEDAVFNLDKDDPLGPEGYGAIIPSPNTAGALYVDGTNQGKFTVTNWLGGTLAEEVVNYPGEDISLYYPTDLFGYGVSSFSLTDDIDPWNEVQWLNVSAYNAEAETLSPFTVSTVFDYYAMGEGGVFTQPFNYKHPMQIDLIVKSTGPKVLKFDWLTIGTVGYGYALIAPSGKLVDSNVDEAVFMGTDTLYDYLLFSASEVGAYRLIVGASSLNPASLNLEFLDTDISSLSLNTVKFAANFDDFATLDVSKIANWQSNWFKFTGKKGEVFRLDIFEDFATGNIPTIDIWTPCANGYFLDPDVGTGNHDIYFAKSGAAYVSLTDTDFEDWYRYALLLTKADNVKYTLGDKNTFSISMDETKTIQFSVQEDSIIRFNYTSLPNPSGAPAMDALGTPNAFIFRDSKEYECYDINSAILTRTVDSTDFYWHYMPAGTYKAVIKNTNPLANGLFQISSQVYDWLDETIPVNPLTYPKEFPSEFVTIEFQPDSEFLSLKNPVGIDIEIPDIGQFRLNTTFWASDNPDTATGFPSYLYMYNSTGPADYYSFGYPQPAFSLDGDPTVGDYLYIGSPTRWTGMVFDFSVLGASGTMEPYVYDGGWFVLDEDNDGTSELTVDGTIEFDITDPNFAGWDLGTGGLIIDPTITEADYYWMRLECTGDYNVGTVPVIQQLTLLNLTIVGDLQFILIGESGYEYDDYWGPTGITQPTDVTNLEVGLDDDDGGYLNYDSEESYIIDNPGGPLWTNGFEGGTYRLLIIPEQWNYNGSVTVQFAVENFWGYTHQATYDIGELTPTPNLHAIDITNYTFTGYSNLTGSIYDYGLITEYNHTESYNPHTGYSYFALECYGESYQWTQLVATVKGLGGGEYYLYILQDLPWIDTSGPNFEVREFPSGGPGGYNVNRTFEFGAFSDHFTLLFEVDAPVDANVSFYLSLSQYDTIMLTTSDVKASLPLDLTLVIALAIIIPAAAGAVVVVYVLKKKGKILTKRPS